MTDLPLTAAHGVQQAGARGLVVDEHGAGAAPALAAAVLRAGQPQVLAQDLEQDTLRIGGHAALRPLTLNRTVTLTIVLRWAKAF